jgi:uncharacterized membrane protein
LFVLVGIVAIGAIDVARHLPRMPARMAVHFDAAGRANGWMAPGWEPTLIMCLVIAVVTASAFLTRYLPPSLINVPNRDYWFAPERRRDSSDRLCAHLLWMAAITAGLLVAVDHLVFMANLQPASPRLPTVGFVVVMATFLVAIVAWTIRMRRLFPRRPKP